MFDFQTIGKYKSSSEDMQFCITASRSRGKIGKIGYGIANYE